MRTNMSLCVKQLNAYIYNLCARSDLYVRVTHFARKATYASRSLSIVLTWIWQSMDDSFKVLMTVDGLLDCSSRCNDHRWSIRLFFDRPDSFPRRICLKDTIFRLLFATILTSDWAVLFKGFDLPSFLCNNLGFWSGRPSCLVLRVLPNVQFYFHCPLDNFYLLNPVY